MKILFIAPLPPPITGHSLVSKVLLDELIINNEVEVINLSKESFKEGIDSFKRIFEVFRLLKEAKKKKKDVGVIYLTIAESFAGNLKDLVIYLICFTDISKIFIHLHGGSIKRLLWDQHPLLAKVNKYFISRIGGAIITGKSHLPIFKGILPEHKIHIVPNFAQEYLFVTEKSIEENFLTNPLRILYMSNLIPKKGYNELGDAFLKMNDINKKKVQIDFAGKFESEESRTTFLNKISGFDQVQYHGLVNDQQKKELFSKAHILCLPTSYYEGQPIAILEAYASGCVVITTGQSGIRDIFQDKLNGFEIEVESADSIRLVIEALIDKQEELKQIALINLSTALEKYRTHIYIKSLTNILNSVN